MAQKIIIKNSSTPAKVPLTSDVDLGELAINTNDGLLFLKKNDGVEAIVTIGEGQTPGPHDHDASNITSGTLVVARGGTGVTTKTGTGANVQATAPSLASPAMTGTPTAPTASAATATTQVATTAFVNSGGALNHQHTESDITNLDKYTKTEVDDKDALKADKAITIASNDTSLMGVSNPTLADNVTMTFPNINSANGIVKIGGDGFIPIALLPASQKEMIGSWDASGNTLPPNASMRGEYYVVSDAGTLMLWHEEGGPLISTGVIPGDELIYSATSGAWYYGPGRSATNAAAVEFDNTGMQVIASTNVQDALSDVDVSVNNHHTNQSNPHNVTAEQVGASPTGHDHSGVYEPANTNIQTHIGTVTGNPHAVTYGQLGGVPTDFTPNTEATQDIVGGMVTGNTEDGITVTYQDVDGTLDFANTDKGSTQNIFKIFAVAGQSNVVADANNDTITWVAGANVTLITNATTDSITISSTNTNTEYTAGIGLDLNTTVFSHELLGITDVNNSLGVVVQDIGFDTLGHVNSTTSVNLDNRYLQPGANVSELVNDAVYLKTTDTIDGGTY